jgi:hypothetical protein
VQTDLGPRGNERVAAAFEAYKSGRQSCKVQDTGRRILLTGFGVFSGADYNISGVVAGSFADAKFTPEKIDLHAPFSPAGAPDAGRVESGENGAHVINRSLFIQGQRYEICFLKLDVLWDLAAAIIIHEANRFQPEMILMTGRGADVAELEGGAFNYAMPGMGYNSDGSLAEEVTPVSSNPMGDEQIPILKNAPMRLAMSWDNKKLHTRIAPSIKKLGFETLVHADARWENSYICNNVSYAVLAATRDLPITLAGDKVLLTPHLDRNTVVGFFHFPAAASHRPASVAAWIQVLATIIDGTK